VPQCEEQPSSSSGCCGGSAFADVIAAISCKPADCTHAGANQPLASWHGPGSGEGQGWSWLLGTARGQR